MKWAPTVYHGLPQGLRRPSLEPGRYLAFLGRISPEKRVDRAIEIARRTGRLLKVAAKVDALDRDYFGSHVEPYLTRPAAAAAGRYSGAIGLNVERRTGKIDVAVLS